MTEYTTEQVWEIAMEYKNAGKEDKIKWLQANKRIEELEKEVERLRQLTTEE